MGKLLRNVRVFDYDDLTFDVVGIGLKVKLKDLDFEFVEYQIVGSTESDPNNNKTSNESPIGKAQMGREMGETVDIAAPAGVI